ncbi:D-2-hydroxyacid dehydrogenase family protein [Knoellia koreensis]|uniref:D-2-hydroxyacid dehydrogenase family protein n=1 Tax=Knoellia koreensis TaxID=2730921 RepID=A0A849HJT6_9MICO|nr:D-2-hydroxyacid dehydrogenase family protein [Knoellia sp. DB2414S]NNM47419.1 D-2-hydroxyacid dehydrogenase family protein [Knoellia sp. DB2414S]
MRIAILDDYAGAFAQTQAARRLAGHEVVAFADSVRGDELVARLDGFDAAVLLQQRTRVPREVAERLTTVRLVTQTGRSTAHLDLDALAAQGVTVCAGGLSDPVTTAELTWALILAAQRNLPEEAARLRSGQWQHTVGRRLAGRTLGIWGLGRIGGLLARYGTAFGMDILVWGREGSLEQAREQGYAVAPDRAALFAMSDVLSVHLPLNESTRGIVTAEDLGRMGSDALFVNTSRAALVAPGALEASLLAGRPGRAAIDVFDDEPVLGASDPLLALPQVTATPHLGYVERDVLETLYAAAADQVLAYADGNPVDVVAAPAR